MTNITISGMTQEQFHANVKAAIEAHTGSTIKKEHLVTKAVTTILGQSNEHTIPMVFSKNTGPVNTGPVMPSIHDKPVIYDASRYRIDEYDMGIHGMLDVELAKQIIEYIYASECWFLAPFMDGVFDIKEEALSFVEQFPNHALSLVVSTNSSSGCVSAVINSHNGGLVLLDDENYLIIKGSESLTIDSFFEKIHGVMSKVAAAHNGDSDYYAIPYIPKGSHFINYVNNHDYFKSEHGSLDANIAKSLIDAVYESASWFIASLDGVIFKRKQDALSFFEIFSGHPLYLVAEAVSPVGCVAVLVNQENEALVLRSDNTLDIIHESVSSNTSELIDHASNAMRRVIDKENPDAHCHLVPFHHSGSARRDSAYLDLKFAERRSLFY